MKYPIAAHTKEGHVWFFDCLEEAVLKINRSYPIDKLTYGYLRYFSARWMESIGGGDDVIFKDELGLIIPVWKVKETFYNTPRVSRERKPSYWFRRYHVKPHHFRNQPVPHTGKRKWGGFRKIRTTQEIRETDFLFYDEELKEYRFKIRRLCLPDDREDIGRSDWDNKNWKKNRKHQWREKMKEEEIEIKEYRIGRVNDMGIDWDRWWVGEPPAVRGNFNIETRTRIIKKGPKPL